MTKLKAPNTKDQTPEKLQAPSSNLEARAADWSLELGISLVFGAWCLVFRFLDFSGARCLGFSVSFRMWAGWLRGVSFVVLGLATAFRACGLGVLVPAYFYPA